MHAPTANPHSPDPNAPHHPETSSCEPEIRQPESLLRASKPLLCRKMWSQLTLVSGATTPFPSLGATDTGVRFIATKCSERLWSRGIGSSRGESLTSPCCGSVRLQVVDCRLCVQSMFWFVSFSVVDCRLIVGRAQGARNMSGAEVSMLVRSRWGFGKCYPSTARNIATSAFQTTSEIDFAAFSHIYTLLQPVGNSSRGQQANQSSSPLKLVCLAACR